MASKLLESQWQFARMISQHLGYVHSQGYRVSLGDAWSKLKYGAHSRHSFHYRRLALDINLFSKNGIWLRNTEDHDFLGLFWESLGGSWGGHWGDGNHYSLGETPRRIIARTKYEY